MERFHLYSGAFARLAIIFAALFSSAALSTAEPIRGSGSTFAAPVISRWSQAYEAARTDGGEFTSPDWKVDYEPIGSLAGIMRLEQPEMDFAATDAPLPPEELARRGWAQFPVVMGGVVVVANIEGLAAGALKLSGPVLADIYMGKVQNWSDPAIQAMNPDTALPDAKIEVLHRRDGSGSTFTFTSFLSKASPEWQQKLGADTLISWPVGRGEKGTGGLAALTAATKNSVAYLEYGQVVRAGLPFVALQNQAGNFISPEPATFQAGLAQVGWDGARDFFADTTNLAGAEAYPMAAVTYAIVPKNRDQGRAYRVLDLFRLAFAQGGEAATALGYIPVSSDLSKQIEAYWAGIFGAVNN